MRGRARARRRPRWTGALLGRAILLSCPRRSVGHELHERLTPMPRAKRRPSHPIIVSLLGSLLLLVVVGSQLVLVGDGWTLVVIAVGAPAAAVGCIWLTKRSMARGRTAEQMIEWWFDLPVIGRFLRFSDRMNSRMGRGSAIARCFAGEG